MYESCLTFNGKLDEVDELRKRLESILMLIVQYRIPIMFIRNIDPKSSLCNGKLIRMSQLPLSFEEDNSSYYLLCHDNKQKLRAIAIYCWCVSSKTSIHTRTTICGSLESKEQMLIEIPMS
ncbi:hypothetical protein ACS0TY_006172 [Phlomoides rotata]